MDLEIFWVCYGHSVLFLIMSRWSDPFAISILRRSNNISSICITTTLSIFQGFFWYFQVLGHFWARIMSMHHFSRFLSSPRLLPELLEVAKWGSKPVSCFFLWLVRIPHSQCEMWTLSWKWFSTHYILKMDYSTLLLICS